MGADLIVHIAPWPKRRDGSYYEWEELAARALAQIPALSEETLARVYDTHMEFEREDGWQDRTRERLAQAVADALIYHREVVCYDWPRGWLMVAGGMSWGDEPTEGYSGLILLDEAGLLDDDPAVPVAKASVEEAGS